MTGGATPCYSVSVTTKLHHMPNQRDQNKTMLRVWIEKDKLQQFKEYAVSIGATMSALLSAFVDEKTAEHRRNKWKKKA